MRRLSDPNFAARYFCGNGIDIGGAPDPMGVYRELFPRMARYGFGTCKTETRNSWKASKTKAATSSIRAIVSNT